MNRKNLKGCAGMYFSAKINGKEVVGRIQEQGESVYLCQNKVNGACPADKLGYKFGYCVSIGGDCELKMANVTDLKLQDEEGFVESYKDWQMGDKVTCNRGESEELEVIFRSGELVVCKDKDGDATSNYTANELHEDGYRLKLPECKMPVSEIVEVTINEIARMKGVEPSQIRIRKEKPLEELMRDIDKFWYRYPTTLSRR